MTTTDETKQCPFCAETIHKDAVICRFCNHDLRTGAPIASAQPQIQSTPTPTPVVQARSGIFDGVKIGAGMFIVLPLLCIFACILLYAVGGAVGR